MATVKKGKTGFAEKLSHSIREGLKIAGITAKVDTEPLAGTKLLRVYVTSPAFEHLNPSERQDLIWRIVGFDFNRDEQLRISMILALSPREMKGAA